MHSPRAAPGWPMSAALTLQAIRRRSSWLLCARVKRREVQVRRDSDIETTKEGALECCEWKEEELRSSSLDATGCLTTSNHVIAMCSGSKNLEE